MQPKTLAATGAAVAATAVVGGLASTDVQSRWYATLDKPGFQPPPVVFPVAWTLLYADIAVASAVVSDRLRADGAAAAARAYHRALGVNLLLNASWTWVFFRAHRLPAATAVAAGLAVSSADLARRASAVGPVPGAALLPYVAWCAFAAVLSGTIWRRNRG